MAVAGDQDYKLADAHCLYLLVRPNGLRLWRMKCRVAGKESCRPSAPVGTFP